MAVGDSYQVPLGDLSMEKAIRDRTSQALRELIGDAGTGGGGRGVVGPRAFPARPGQPDLRRTVQP